VTAKGVDDTTIPFAAIGEVRMETNQRYPALLILPTPSGTFPEHQGGGYNDGDYQSHQMHFYFRSEAAAQQAHDFFEYHRCLRR
jgi:hypothetical protein